MKRILQIKDCTAPKTPESSKRSRKCNGPNITDLTDPHKNGELLSFLKSSTAFPESQVYSIIASLNEFKAGSKSLKRVKDVFIIIIKSEFITATLEPIIKKYFRNLPKNQDIEAMIIFLTNISEVLPRQSIDKMALIFPGLHFASQKIGDSHIDEVCTRLERSLEAAKRMEEPSPFDIPNKKAENNFREISVIPRQSDIFCATFDVHLKRNKFFSEEINDDIEYDSVDDYLDTQFRLLREDFVRPLRDSIARIMEQLVSTSSENTKKLDVRLYYNVVINELYTSRNGLVHKVTFDVKRFSTVDWKKSKRFIFGSLLCFTNDSFETLFFASVVESDPRKLEKGSLVVQFHDDPILEVLNMNQFIMLETINLFEAYRHVLSKLQTFTLYTLPFKEHLAFGKCGTAPPVFLNSKELKLIETEANDDEELDTSQREAFITALQSNLSLIQGPPGTGKTFIGLKIIKYIVNHFQTDDLNFGPILVVSYTNHALDQFLVDIIKAIGVDKVVRVGSRSKIIAMKRCNISYVRSEWMRNKMFRSAFYRRRSKNRKKMEIVEEEVIKGYLKVKNYDSKILSVDDLSVYFSTSHLDFFETTDFDSWIREGSLEPSMDVEAEGIKDVVHEQSICIVKSIKNEIKETLKEKTKDNDAYSFEDERYDEQMEEDLDLMKEGNTFERLYHENEEALKTSMEENFDNLILMKLRNLKVLTEDEYLDLPTLDTLDFVARLRLYKYWLQKYLDVLVQKYDEMKAWYDILRKERDDISAEEYIDIMRRVNVIGMTTTGAARYAAVLEEVGCKVVVVEEAAEVLESHVICALNKRCDQLIMIGDHKQLRPKVTVFELEKEYNLGISLFERLIANKCKYVTLQSQHRMRPEISSCVRSIYPDLRDSENVLEYSSIVGMRRNVYFFNHINKEKENDENSFKNGFEADFIVKFCDYLVDSGNLPSKITVLTFYTGQLQNISDRMRQPRYKGVRICVVDNFQGEESDIIILSMVRSNKQNKVGFLKSPNRLCVALSRAKRGFYAIGNFAMLRRNIDLLDNILSRHITTSDFGSKLPLSCLMHPDADNYYVENIKDFRDKGCPFICGTELPCGHFCSWRCHLKSPSHINYKCLLPCQRLCDRGLHKCHLSCFIPCSCKERITLQLPCMHEKTISCHEDNVKCMEMCSKVLSCKHQCRQMCHEPCVCKIEVMRILLCNHRYVGACGSEVRCQYKCNAKLKCFHRCEGQCGQCFQGRFHIACLSRCMRVLPCGHPCQLDCHPGICPPCGRPCPRYCEHSKCSLLCGSICECVICERNCGKIIRCLSCNKNESCSKPCGQPCSNLCRSCSRFQSMEISQCFIMKPCNCLIRKNDFKPKQKIKGHALWLMCQRCHRDLNVPYFDVFFIYFKRVHSESFRCLPKDDIERWADLAQGSEFGEVIEQILKKMKKLKVHRDSTYRFDTSFTYLEKFISIYKDVPLRDVEGKMQTFSNLIKKALDFMMRWLDPFIREFDEEENDLLKLQHSKISLLLDILLELKSMAVAEYGLRHKTYFDMFFSIYEAASSHDLEKLRNAVMSMQNGDNSRKSAKDEEDLLDQIISTKHLDKEFHIEEYGVRQKIKKIKDLLRKCHPDKNKSYKAKRATQILVSYMKSLRKTIKKDDYPNI